MSRLSGIGSGITLLPFVIAGVIFANSLAAHPVDTSSGDRIKAMHARSLEVAANTAQEVDAGRLSLDSNCYRSKELRELIRSLANILLAGYNSRVSRFYLLDVNRSFSVMRRGTQFGVFETYTPWAPDLFVISTLPVACDINNKEIDIPSALRRGLLVID